MRALAVVAQAAALVAACGALAACGGSSGPDESAVAGAYRLARIGEQPVPYVFFRDADGHTLSVAHARLVVRSRGRMLDIKETCRDGCGPGAATLDTQVVPYRVAGRLVLLTRAHPGVATYADTGFLGADGRMEVHLRAMYYGAPGGPFVMTYIKD